MPSQPPQILFLETSALVDLVMGKGQSAEFEEAIHGESGRRPVRVSNHYVRMELKRGVLQYLVYLHKVVCDARAVEDVFRTVHGLSKGLQRHRLGTVLEAIVGFWKRVGKQATGDEPMDEYLLRKLGDYLATLIVTIWESPVIYTDGLLANPMGCFVDIREPKLDGGRFSNRPHTCERSQQRCSIVDYFRDRKAEFAAAQAALDQIEEPDGQQASARSQLREIRRKADYGSYELGNQNKHAAARCWTCGDIILAVSAPASCTILTSNTRHFAPLARSLDKRVLPEPPPP